MFTAQKERRGVDQAQFHLPPAQSLLRLHDPSAFGDDLTRSGRSWWRSIASKRRARASPSRAAGRRSSAWPRSRTPQGNHIGSFEFGLDFGRLIDGLKAAYGLDFTVFIEEKPLREFAQGLNPAC